MSNAWRVASCMVVEKRHRLWWERPLRMKGGSVESWGGVQEVQASDDRSCREERKSDLHSLNVCCRRVVGAWRREWFGDVYQEIGRPLPTCSFALVVVAVKCPCPDWAVIVVSHASMTLPPAITRCASMALARACAPVRTSDGVGRPPAAPVSASSV